MSLKPSWPFLVGRKPADTTLPIEMLESPSAESLPATGAAIGGSSSMISSPTVGRETEGPRRDLDGPKDRDAGHVPPPLAKGGAASAATAGRGLVRTAIVEIHGVKLLLDGFVLTPGFKGDFVNPPEPATVEFDHIFVMRGGEVFKVNIMPFLPDSTLDLIEKTALADYGEQ